MDAALKSVLNRLGGYCQQNLRNLKFLIPLVVLIPESKRAELEAIGCTIEDYNKKSSVINQTIIFFSTL